jgi:hypothetical protein
VRTSILLWSTVSGAILGLFIDATLIGAAFLFGVLVPVIATRLQARWLGLTAVAVLAIIPLSLAVLGFLEGELKLR